MEGWGLHALVSHVQNLAHQSAVGGVHLRYIQHRFVTGSRAATARGDLQGVAIGQRIDERASYTMKNATAGGKAAGTNSAGEIDKGKGMVRREWRRGLQRISASRNERRVASCLLHASSRRGAGEAQSIIGEASWLASSGERLRETAAGTGGNLTKGR
jgi:hypothetical protein